VPQRQPSIIIKSVEPLRPATADGESHRTDGQQRLCTFAHTSHGLHRHGTALLQFAAMESSYWTEPKIKRAPKTLIRSASRVASSCGPGPMRQKTRQKICQTHDMSENAPNRSPENLPNKTNAMAGITRCKICKYVVIILIHLPTRLKPANENNFNRIQIFDAPFGWPHLAPI
jgi:hypothetical protein